MAALLFYGVPGKFTWRMGAVVLVGQSIAVFLGALVARALGAAADNRSATTYLLVGSGLAVLCLLTAGLMRRPYGVTLGWVLQVATFLCALVVPMMLVVGLMFTALWVTCLWQGQRIDAIQAGR
ncbi:MAG: DUF4233 domain-containing protein [Actinomycetota bacterium]|nr:DUF4233 domain-containing protein [Actinomycetota bacterium]